MKKLIMTVAALSVLAVPSVASANGDLEGQLINVAARAVEGVEVLPNPGNTVFFNDGGSVLDSRVRARFGDTPGVVDRLYWRADGLQIQDPNDPGEQSAIDAPDGTQLETDIYALTSVNLVLAGSPATILLTTGMLIPEFRGAVTDPAGNPLLATVEDQAAEQKFRPEQDDSVIPNLDPAECNLYVLADQNGNISAASTFDEQAAC